ncbi:MAG TPA: protein translocase subunit SecD [Gemmatimonadaceae bacterium]|nr:protein translocase subunit SecD [Gemmatimonadaceae bacterium]
MSLRTRLLIIAALVLASAWTLYPRNVTQRVRMPDGSFRDTVVRRVPIKYGLDLSGGMHLALEVDESRGAVANKAEAIDRALKVVRNRVDEFGVAEPVVQKVGSDRIIVELPGVSDQAQAERLVKESAFLQFQITDETRALDKVMPRIDQVLRAKGVTRETGKPGDTTQSNKALTNLFSSADSGAQADSARRDTAAAKDTAADTALFGAATDGPFSRLVQPGQMPGEYVVAKNDVETVRRYLAMPEVQAVMPPAKVLRWGQEEGAQARDVPFQRLYVLDARPIITGEYLIDAKPATDPVEGNLVQFTLNNEGGRRFRTETQRHIGDYMAIVLDDIVVGQPPVIQSAIGTRGQITMTGKPLQAAQDLALVLRAGALPVPLKVVEARTIGPSLGQDSIHKGMQAGVLGVILVVLIMVVYYRFSGVLAVTALLLYGLFTLAVLAGFDATLTLPGLAGFVLSIGIAVDANVLIFERIREELVHGKTVRASIDEGFKHAMSAIIDSNVSTILTAAVLYPFGTGPVKGFAVTLIAGIAASMVSAIFVVRTFFLLWLQRNRGAQTLSI